MLGGGEEGGGGAWVCVHTGVLTFALHGQRHVTPAKQTHEPCNDIVLEGAGGAGGGGQDYS